MLSSFLSTFLYVFTSLVTVVNPIGAAMFFLTITSGATRAQRMTLSNKVCIYFLIMALVMLRSQKYFTARQTNLSALNGYIEECTPVTAWSASPRPVTA